MFSSPDRHYGVVGRAVAIDKPAPLLWVPIFIFCMVLIGFEEVHHELSQSKSNMKTMRFV